MGGRVIALAGNPNTGKSTIFNRLTGLKQHTGNWSGKTVGTAAGWFEEREIVDLPGMYSLKARSEDEAAAVNFLKEGRAEVVVVVLDGTCLERNLILTLQILDVTQRVIVCVNMLDEAEKKGIEIDIEGLAVLLGVNVIGMAAGRNMGFDELKMALRKETERREIKGIRETEKYTSLSSEIYKQVVKGHKTGVSIDRKIDGILLSRRFGIPAIAVVFGIMLWITAAGANYPSVWLENIFNIGEDLLCRLLEGMGAAPWLKGLLAEGIYGTVGRVVSVMLPPMAIFFPLFTFLEDFGFLPRIAFNLDRCFKRAGTNGKQALTMCMGIGCNACGVSAARIIETPKERNAAILTNVFMPCNGRFSMIILLGVIFFSAGTGSSLAAALAVLAALCFGVIITLAVTAFIMRGEKSSFVLELPPYRMPNIKEIVIRSVLDRIIFVLARAVMVALPAGAIIWALSSCNIQGRAAIWHIARFFEPLGRLMGMDGCTLTGFLLGMPANEIVMPLILVMYGGSGSTGEILAANGWGIKTAVCAIIFCICHFPCTTTLLTIKKETGSLKLTGLAFLLPTVCGIVICILINFIFCLAEML